MNAAHLNCKLLKLPLRLQGERLGSNQSEHNFSARNLFAYSKQFLVRENLNCHEWDGGRKITEYLQEVYMADSSFGWSSADEGPEIGSFADNPNWPAFIDLLAEHLGLGHKPAVVPETTEDEPVKKPKPFIEDVTERSTLKDLSADSLDIVELMMDCEDQFDGPSRDSDLEGIVHNVGQVFAYFMRRSDQKNELVPVIAGLLQENLGTDPSSVDKNTDLQALYGDEYDRLGEFIGKAEAATGGTVSTGQIPNKKGMGAYTVGKLADALLEDIDP